MTKMTKAGISTYEPSCLTRQQTPLPQSPFRLPAQSFSPRVATTGSTPPSPWPCHQSSSTTRIKLVARRHRDPALVTGRSALQGADKESSTGAAPTWPSAHCHLARGACATSRARPSFLKPPHLSSRLCGLPRGWCGGRREWWMLSPLRRKVPPARAPLLRTQTSPGVSTMRMPPTREATPPAPVVATYC